MRRRRIKTTTRGRRKTSATGRRCAESTLARLRRTVAALTLGRAVVRLTWRSAERRRVAGSRWSAVSATALAIRVEAGAGGVSHHRATERIHARRCVMRLRGRSARVRLRRKRLSRSGSVLIRWSAGRRIGARWSARRGAIAARRWRRHTEHGAFQRRTLGHLWSPGRRRSAGRRSSLAWSGRRRSTRSARRALLRGHHQHGPLELGGSRAL
jgi:hypothetical protein